MTGQVLILENGLNPSAANSSLTLRGSDVNSTYLESNDFQALELAGFLINLSFVRPSTCHFMWGAISGDINNPFNLGFRGNHLKIFAAFFFNFLEAAFVFFGTSASLLAHLEWLQFEQASRLEFSFQNNIQSLGQASIFS